MATPNDPSQFLSLLLNSLSPEKRAVYNKLRTLTVADMAAEFSDAMDRDLTADERVMRSCINSMIEPIMARLNEINGLMKARDTLVATGLGHINGLPRLVENLLESNIAAVQMMCDHIDKSAAKAKIEVDEAKAKSN